MSLVKVKDGTGKTATIPSGAYKVLKNIAGYTLVEEKSECTEPAVIEKKPVVVEEPQIEIEKTEVKVDGELQQPKKIERKVNRKTEDKVDIQ